MAQDEAKKEWALYWPVVLAGVFGMSFISVSTASLGLFMGPLEQEFGWERKQISISGAIGAGMSMIALPLVGAAVDRGFSRPIALVGLAGSALVLASLGLSNGNIYLWCFQWLLFAIFISGVNPLVWSAAVSNQFKAARGMALGIVLSGSSIGSATAPLVARWLIDQYEWRGAFFGLALIYGTLAFVLVALFFERHAPRRTAAQSAEATALLPGLTFKEAMRSHYVILILAATLLAFMVMVGIMIHAAPMLENRGASLGTAALGAATLAAFMLVGKMVLGWALDFAPGHLIGAITYAIPGAACLMLLESSGGDFAAFVALAALGFGFGGIVQLTAYLTGRYIGMRSYGRVFGVISSLMAMAGGIGPIVSASIYDATRSYDLLLSIAPIAAIGSALCILFLGRYPTYATPAAADSYLPPERSQEA